MEKITEYIEPDIKQDGGDEETSKKAISLASEDSEAGTSLTRKAASSVRFSLKTPEIIIPDTEKIIQFHTYDDGAEEDIIEAVQEPEDMVTIAEELQSFEEPERSPSLAVQERVLANKEMRRLSSKLLFVRDSKEILEQKLKAKRQSDTSNGSPVSQTRMGIRTDLVRDSLVLKTRRSLESRLSGT